MTLKNGQFDAEEWLKKLENSLGYAHADIAKAVKTAIKETRKIVGDYPGLYGLIQTWITAVGPISTAQSNLQAAQTNLPGAWTGTAATEYNTYLTDLQKSSSDLSDCMSDGSGGIVDLLMGVASAISHNYETYVDLTVKYADAVINAVSSVQAGGAQIVAGVLSDDLGQAVDGATGVNKAIAKAMTDFIDAFGNWVKGIMQTNDSLHKNIYGIEVKVQKLVVPAPSGY
jgi:uncharacterized protein YukE